MKIMIEQCMHIAYIFGELLIFASYMLKSLTRWWFKRKKKHV